MEACKRHQHTSNGILPILASEVSIRVWKPGRFRTGLNTIIINRRTLLTKTKTISVSSHSKLLTKKPSFGPLERTKMARSELDHNAMRSYQDPFSASSKTASQPAVLVLVAITPLLCQKVVMSLYAARTCTANLEYLRMA